MARLEVSNARPFPTVVRRSLCAPFLAVKKLTTVGNYREQFEALSAPLPRLAEEVLKSTFLNGLDLKVRVEVLCFELVGLGQIRKAAQRVKDERLVVSSN